MKKIILASSSAPRKILLDRLQIPYTIIAPNIDESACPGETTDALVKRLSEEKARAVAEQAPDALIIGSDQLLALGDQQIGKPLTHEAAVAQLTQMSGKAITALAGLCLYNSKTQRVQVDIEYTQATFRTLTPETLEIYLRKEEPYFCAGSLKAESLGIALFEKLTSDDPTALIGLPLIKLVSMLANEGVNVC